MTTHKLVASPIQDRQLAQDNIPGIHSPGKFAKRPAIGLLMFIFGSLVFGALFYNLMAQGPLLQWDKTLSTVLPAIGLQNAATLKPIMDAGYYLGGWGVIILTVLFGIYFIAKRYWQELTMLLIGTAGSTAIFWTISNLVGRIRPPTQIWIILKIPGFPSGHTLSAVAFFGLIAYLLAPENAISIWERALLLSWQSSSCSLLALPGSFTAAHYLTDVLAGYALGIAWSGAAYTLIEIYFQKRRNQNVKQE